MHELIRYVIGRVLEPLDARTDSQIELDGPVGRILMVKTKEMGESP
jgi:hypothetical protein